MDLSKLESNEQFVAWLRGEVDGRSEDQLVGKRMYPALTLEKWKAALHRPEALESETRALKAALRRTLKGRRLYVGRSGGEWVGRVCKRKNGGDLLLVSINQIEPILWFKHYGEVGHIQARDGTLHA
mmetsp:Transcript_21686/g.53506  ORF Transcript_21686/g.53506 Transcript_21686/m.53506 type:complete len:127 (+) Transcript_21686:177-557(+)|eukprot:CAMPEP_0174913130 /NCGR_PEP_ID=MMETSP0167-20121228/80156_1 /TAXON_ID=38298 /ORGANISM="Rhodella maculata, Strain CCMP736" /LENGTH=126 /DNA_ID=CAMNT_0016157835 /DNA_START=118 /DNA_END=498 /DNA_ORIENTATION=+